MEKNQGDELMMNEISVKSLQEISGGAAISVFPVLTGLIRPTAGIIAIPPITAGFISKPMLPKNIISLK